jgi:hypothetical protein
MPRRAAISIAARAPPAFSSTRTLAVLTELASASSSVISPRGRQVPLPGDQPPRLSGVSATKSSGAMPCSSAARK